MPWATRKVTKLIKYITRRGVAKSLGVEGWCYDSRKPCIVWKNNEIWPQQDEVVRTLSHGDYIRCVIPGDRDRRCFEEAQVANDGLSLAQKSVVLQTSTIWTATPAFDIEVATKKGSALDGQQDEAALMQFGPVMPESSHTPSSAATRSINIYAWGQDYIDVPVEEHMTMVESITYHWGIEANDVIDLHEVLEPPIPLQVPGELVFVMEMRGRQFA